MKSSADKISPPIEVPEPKFNIKHRFEKLNNSQKRILIQEYMDSFKLNKTSAYYTIRVKESLSDEELFFFADMFSCEIADLYNKKPTKRPTVFELEAQADARPAA